MNENTEKANTKVELERFFSVSSDLFCIKDFKGNFLKLNKAWESLLGYSIDKIKNSEFLSFIHPDDLENTIKAIDESSKGKPIINFINRYRCKNGLYKYIEWQSQPYDGLIYASARDVTDRVEKQKIIEENEENFRTFFETVDDFMFVAETNGDILHTNKAVKEKLGYSNDELQLMNLFDVYTEMPRFEHNFIFTDMIKKIKEYIPSKLKKKDGSFILVETKVWFGKWNGKECFYGMAKDLSKQNESLDKFQKVFHNNLVIMTVTDTATGEFIEVNSAFLNKLGYSKEEVLGKKAPELGLILHKGRYNEFNTMVRSGNKVNNIELEIKKKDGNILTGLFSGEVINNQNSRHFLTVVVDITEERALAKERSKTEQMLRESEERYAAIVDNAPEIVVIRKGNNIVFINKTGIKILGYSESEIIGRNIYDFVDDELKFVVTEAIKRKETGENIEDYEIEFISKLGNKLNLITKTIPITFQKEPAVLTVLIDITDRKRIEEELRRSKQHLEFWFDTMSMGVLFQDIKGNIVKTNKAAEEILGMTNEQLLNKNAFDKSWKMIAEDGSEFIPKLSPKVNNISSGDPVEDFVIAVFNPRKNEHRWLKINIVPEFRDNQLTPHRIYTTFEDITERKLQEAEMNKKENILSALAASIKLLLDVRDYYRAVASCLELLGNAIGVDKAYLYQNKYDDEGKAITSLKVEWNSGKSIPQVDNLNIYDIPFEDVKVCMDKLKEGEAFYGIVREFDDVQIRDFFEAQEVISVIKFPVFVRGEFWGYIGLEEFKYERLWTETEFSTLSAFANSLERAIERRMVEEELETAKVAAEAANVMKSRFLANMSHEIRTPMNGIMGFMELLQMTNLSSEQQEFIREAKSASEVLLYVINDILDFSKIEAGKLSVEKTRFNIRTAIEDAVSLIVPKASEKNIELQVYINSSVPEEVIGDPARLRQVINNLVSNAVKFTEVGEIIIDVKSSDLIEEGKVRIDFDIKDTGIGIDEDVIGKLFKPFTQADSSMTRKFGGTGLGLAISRELVRLMEGDISAQSILGQGSTFSFYICVEMVKKASNPKIMAKIKNENILIVDDNEKNRRIFRSYLEEAECKVFEAAGADEAITTILLNAHTENSIKVAIIDYQMPLMDGYQLAETLKHIPTANNVKMILLTSAAQRGDAKVVKEHGFSGFLTKPVKRGELLDCIAIVLGLKEVNERDNEIITKYTVNEERKSQRTRILLVEDSEINRKIVVKMLNLKGYTCDIALDGAAAVKAFNERSYDIVLMDCQMPVMDGYESTAKIREIEGNEKRTTIIAMTANAMEGDRKKCIDAGMDDYISKPLNFEVLFKMIDDYVKERKPEQFNLIYDNIEKFADSIGLGKVEAKQLYDEYMEYLAKCLKNIDEAADSAEGTDFAKMKMLAQQLKDPSGNLTITSVYNFAIELENAAAKNEIEECRKLILEIKKLLY